MKQLNETHLNVCVFEVTPVSCVEGSNFTHTSCFEIPLSPPSEEPVSVETCRALTNELQSCFRSATHLYRKVSQDVGQVNSERVQLVRCQVELVYSRFHGNRGLTD